MLQEHSEYVDFSSSTLQTEETTIKIAWHFFPCSSEKRTRERAFSFWDCKHSQLMFCIPKKKCCRLKKKIPAQFIDFVQQSRAVVMFYPWPLFALLASAAHPETTVAFTKYQCLSLLLSGLLYWNSNDVCLLYRNLPMVMEAHNIL